MTLARLCVPLYLTLYDTASENLMMERLIVDDLVHWAKDYKVDGFRFDLMGHLMLRTVERARDALAALTVEKDGVDGAGIYMYGEGGGPQSIHTRPHVFALNLRV